MDRRWTWVAWSILTLSIIPVGAGFLFVAEGNAAVIVRGETAEQLDLSQELLARLTFIPFGIVGAVLFGDCADARIEGVSRRRLQEVPDDATR